MLAGVTNQTGRRRRGSEIHHGNRGRLRSFPYIARSWGLLFTRTQSRGSSAAARGGASAISLLTAPGFMTKTERACIAAIAIPPAYEDVRISPMLRGHLQAAGLVDRAPMQYSYNADWTERHARPKFEKLVAFAQTLPTLQRWIGSHLRGEAGAHETAITPTLVLIDRSVAAGRTQCLYGRIWQS
jgi:DNA topoisomerase-1